MISFKGRHFPKDVIFMGIRWYISYPLSYRHVEELMEERGVKLDHATVNRWVVNCSLTLEANFRKYKKPVGEVSLDQFEVRSYPGWCCHMTLVHLAHALLVICKAQIFPLSRHPAPMIMLKKSVVSDQNQYPRGTPLSHSFYLRWILSIPFTLNWSLSRRRHQTIAMTCHHLKRGISHLPHLQL